jgi:hypothetical protein
MLINFAQNYIRITERRINYINIITVIIIVQPTLRNALF